MLKQFYPYAYAESVFAIDYQKLYDKGYRGILFDIDNTLVHHGDPSTKEVDALFQKLHRMGWKTLLLTNNDQERVERFIQNIHTLYLCDAEKPDPSSYQKAIEQLNLPKQTVICIGDQIFTDILGANRSGISSILVKFIQIDGETKIGKRRYLERLILKFYRHSPFCRDRLGNIYLKEEDTICNTNYSAK